MIVVSFRLSTNRGGGDEGRRSSVHLSRTTSITIDRMAAQNGFKRAAIGPSKGLTGVLTISLRKVIRFRPFEPPVAYRKVMPFSVRSSVRKWHLPDLPGGRHTHTHTESILLPAGGPPRRRPYRIRDAYMRMS